MKPPLLANENFPAPSTRALRSAGLDVLAIAEGHAGMTDRDVPELARFEGQLLMTFDAGVLLQDAHYRPSEPAQWILRIVVSPAEVTGCFCVLSGNRMRKRPLPALD